MRVDLLQVLLCLAVANPGFLLWASSPAEGTQATLYDTLAPLSGPLTAEQVNSRPGWAAMPGNGAPSKGSAVLLNRHLVLAFCLDAPGVAVYSRGPAGPALRAQLHPASGEAAWVLASVKATANSPAAAAVDADFKSGDGKTATIRFELPAAAPFVKTQPRAGATGLRVEAPSRLGVLPDFFADDMVVDARVVPVERTEVPSENFFMNLVGAGSAMVLSVWDKNQADVRLRLEGKGEERVIRMVELPYGVGGTVWVSVLEAPGLWHAVDVAEGQKRLDLDWTLPFHARWKGNLMCADHSIDSWDFEYHPASRSRWSGVAGSYNHPCWIDGQEGALKAHIEFPGAFLKTVKGSYRGASVIYPMERTEKTPLDRFTVQDVLRESLGVGPCEYIMDLAGQGAADKGIFTCAFEATVTPILACGKQLHERVWIEKLMVEVQVFVQAIQDRINDYVKFRGEMLAYLAAQKKERPECSATLAGMEALLDRIGAKPADGARGVSKLIEQLRPELVADLPKASTKKIPEQVAQIGLGQDDRVARCRMAVKLLRRQAAVAAILDPGFALIAKEIRTRTHAILRGPLGHEMR